MSRGFGMWAKAITSLLRRDLPYPSYLPTLIQREQVIGPRATLFVACAGRLLGPLWLALSPIRHVRDLPHQPEPQPVAVGTAAV